MRDGDWFSETLDPNLRISFLAERVLHAEDTAHQSLALIENASFGRVLLLDSVVQVTSADEFIYHEMLAHVPLFAHGAAEEVLIVGGGDCGLAEEVLKHRNVRRLTQVEIDPSVVGFAKVHFADFNAPVFADDRFDLVIADGARFVHETERRFDVVLVDSTDPVGPGTVLFTEAFYQGVRRCLKPGGVMTSQNGVPFLQRPAFVSAMTGLSRTFSHLSCYLAAVPSYFGGPMAFAFASGSPDAMAVPRDTLERRFAAARVETRCYTPEVHAAAFALPGYIAEAFAEGQSAAATV